MIAEVKGVLQLVVIGAIVIASSCESLGQCKFTGTIDGPTGQFDNYGSQMSFDGESLAVSANTDCTGQGNCGSVFMYRRIARSSYTSEGQLFSPEPQQNGDFGRALSVSQNNLVIASPNQLCEDESFPCGAVFAFRFEDGEWRFTQELRDPDPHEFERFGGSVAMNGDLLAIGNNRGCDPSAPPCGGVVFVYRLSSGNWTFEQILSSSDSVGNELFGTSVAFSGSQLLVGAPGNSVGGEDRGAVYVFEQTELGWSEVQRLGPSDLANDDNFGSRISTDGGVAVVSSRLAFCNVECGAAYVFRRNGQVWTEEQKLEPSELSGLESFGDSTSIQGSRIAVGQWSLPCDAGKVCGGVHIFEYDGTDWVETEILRDEIQAATDFFGRAVALSGDELIVGHSGADCTINQQMMINCGRVEFFECEEAVGLASSVPVSSNLSLIGFVAAILISVICVRGQERTLG